MLFPESDRVIYENSPLTRVIGQLRFPPILEIASGRPAEFQQLIRREYPLYEEDHSIALPAAPGLPKEIAQVISRISSSEMEILYKFLSENSQSYISLKSHFVAFSTDEYDEWGAFRQNMELARQAFEEVYEPAFYTRIGLRYIDIIDKDEAGLEDLPWTDLLRPELLGVLGIEDLGESVNTIHAQADFEIDEVEGARATFRHGMGPIGDEQKDRYLIDVDFYIEERRESEDVNEILDTFNRLAGNLFRWAINPVLHEALGPRPPE